jgi:hypothetical protein
MVVALLDPTPVAPWTQRIISDRKTHREVGRTTHNCLLVTVGFAVRFLADLGTQHGMEQGHGRTWFHADTELASLFVALPSSADDVALAGQALHGQLLAGSRLNFQPPRTGTLKSNRKMLLTAC